MKGRVKVRLRRKKEGRAFRPAFIMVVGFAMVIFVGAALLCLPVSARSGEATSPLTALFTATSATCVTGLVVVDTAQYWSVFGQTVIMVLIQIGGLGFMTTATLFSLLTHRTITLRERMILSTGLNLDGTSGIVRLTRRVLFGTVFFESIGAVVLSLRFIPVYGPLGGIRMGLFHSISAFCNAGFDLMGKDVAFQSLAPYVEDPIVNFTVIFLIVIGGVGFYVWNDIYEKNSFHALRLHTKITVVTTAVLLLSGTLLTAVFEWNNPGTIGQLSFGGKLMASLFQSTTLRTAGFATIDQAKMTGSSQGLGILFMMIGGSPGSTAGGIKTVTAAVLILTAYAAMSGKTNVSVFGRTITARAIMNAVTMVIVGMTLVTVGSILLSLFENAPFIDCMFEATSAFGTVGLSMGLTPGLRAASQITLILLMYLGRVGVLTLGVAVLMRKRSDPKLTYPEGQVMVG